MKKKQLDGEIGAGQRKANFCRTSAAEPVPGPVASDVFTLARRGRRLFLQRERASRLNYSSADGRALTLPRLARAGRPFWARSRGKEEGKEEGRCHKHGNQSDRRREVRIKEQQEERSPGISSLIFLLSRTSQSSPLQ